MDYKNYTSCNNEIEFTLRAQNILLFSALYSFFPRFAGCLQMFDKGNVRVESKDKPDALARPLPELANVHLYVLVPDDDVVLVGKGLHPGDQLRGVDEVYQKHAVEQADHKGKGEVL